jgi:hypothetical protein
MSFLLSLPPEIRLKIWSFCAPDAVEATICHCFNDEEVRHTCWEARKCLTIEINEDIVLPTPSILLVSRQIYEESKSFIRTPVTLVLCRYVCTVMFLYNSTHRQRALVDKIRLTHAIDRPQWHPAGKTVSDMQRDLMERLSVVAAKYFLHVQVMDPIVEGDEDRIVTAEVAVQSVRLDEPSSED